MQLTAFKQHGYSVKHGTVDSVDVRKQGCTYSWFFPSMFGFILDIRSRSACSVF